MSLGLTKLTRLAIRRLEVGESITERGITAEQWSDGDVRYSINVVIDRRRVYRVVGFESENVSPTQAQNYTNKIRDEAKEDRLNLPMGRKLHVTFKQATADYLGKLEEIGGRNLKIKRRHLEQRLVPFFSDQRNDAISAFTVDCYKKRR